MGNCIGDTSDDRSDFNKSSRSTHSAASRGARRNHGRRHTEQSVTSTPRPNLPDTVNDEAIARALQDAERRMTAAPVVRKEPCYDYYIMGNCPRRRCSKIHGNLDHDTVLAVAQFYDVPLGSFSRSSVLQEQHPEPYGRDAPEPSAPPLDQDVDAQDPVPSIPPPDNSSQSDTPDPATSDVEQVDEADADRPGSPVEKVCIICYEQLDGLPVQCLECIHVFHHQCIGKWVSKGKDKCPICDIKIGEALRHQLTRR
eukprot:Sspe_Gene.64844::Locus_38415_Transcript_5_5_Confidence_0.545_Length_933::g.64844::m.64844